MLFRSVTQPQVEVVAVDRSSGAVTTQAAGTPTSYNYYDLLGRLIGTRDANGNVNQVAYNAAGQGLKETHADGSVKRFAYDNFGQQVQVTDEEGFRTRNQYDRGGTYNQILIMDR